MKLHRNLCFFRIVGSVYKKNSYRDSLSFSIGFCENYKSESEMNMRRLNFLFAVSFVLFTSGQAMALTLTQDLCRAWGAGNKAYCQSGDCRGIVGVNAGECDSNDCRGIASGNYAYCETIDCRAIVLKNSALCETNNCRAIVSGDAGYCDNDYCRGIVLHEARYCH